MSKHHALFITGVIIVFLPFLGIPYTFRSILIFFAGLAVCIFAVFLHVEKRAPVRRVIKSRRKSTSTISDTMSTSQLPVEQAHDYQIDADVDAQETR